MDLKLHVSSVLFIACFPILCLCSQCSGPHVSLNVNPDADVKFTAIMSLREPTGDAKCGSKWSDVALQSVAVIQWAVERINNANFIQGVKLGFDVFDDCGIPRYSIGRGIDVVDGYPLGSDACAERNNSVCQIGILGTSSSETTEAVLDIISGTNVPVLSPFATYPKLSQFSNFYRMTLSQDEQIKAIIEFLLEVNWRYIAAVHTDDLFGRYGSQALKDLGIQHGICVDVIYEIPNLNDALTDLFTKLQAQKRTTKDGSLGVVFFGGRNAAKHLLTQLNFRADEVKDVYWIMPDFVGNDVNVFENLDNGAGNKTVVFSKYSTKLTSVRQYVFSKWERAINSSAQPVDELDSLFFCAGKSDYPQWTNQNAESVIDAVYTLTSALQRQQRYYCAGQAGICHGLRMNFNLNSDLINNPLNYTELPDSVTVSEFAAGKRSVQITGKGEVEPSTTETLYELYMYTRYENNSYNFAKVAEILNHTVVATNQSREKYLREIQSSECGPSCPSCIDVSGLRYMYVDGDSLILGLFSFHETNPDDPFQCGDVRFSSSDVLVLEAFLHKLEDLNKDSAIKYGAVIFDDCYSTAHMELIMTQFMSGQISLKKPNSTEIIDKSKILAAVGSLGSDRAIVLSFLFTKLKIPYISSTSSSPDLDDRINFPYFLRTVPSDVEQARAMVEIMKVMGWEYASALYVNNNYGSKGTQKFMQYANESNICVAKSSEALPEADADKIDLQGTFSRLRNQNAMVVMYFGTEARIADFLRIIDNRNDFVFLASEDWGDQEYILEIGQLGTLGSIILKNQGLDLAYDHPFVDYLKQLNPYTNVKNPWFTEYWEHLFNCDLSLSFTNKYATSCDPQQTLTEDIIEGILKNQRAIHIIDALEALWTGLEKSRTELCEFDNVYPCPNYFKYISNVITNIKGVTLQRGNSDVRIFKDDGNGNVGFDILNVQQDQFLNLIYKRVGSFDDQGLHLSKSSIQLRQPSFDAVCTSSLCGHCTNTSKGDTEVEVVTHTNPADQSFTVPHYTIIGLLAFLIVMMLIMMVVVVCYFKRKVMALHKQVIQTCGNQQHNASTPTVQQARNYPYINQNGSAVHSSHGNSKGDYPATDFMRLGPSGETLQDWYAAQMLLNGGVGGRRGGDNGGYVGRNGLNSGSPTRNGGGHVNRAFVGDDSVLSSPSGEGYHLNSSALEPRNTESASNQESPSYKPSKSAYGLSTHNSFKRLDTSSQQTSPIKKQPRTQLAVPPCRPELPPRNDHAQRPDNLDLALPAAVPKEKPRKHRSPPRKSSLSPRELNYTQSFDNNPRNHPNSSELESPRIKGTISNLMFSAGAVQNEEQQSSPTGRINVHGSMEKISRV